MNPDIVIDRKNQLIAALQRKNDELQALLDGPAYRAELQPDGNVAPRNLLATAALGPEGDLNISQERTA